MSWDVVLLTSATALITDFIVGLAKKSPPYLIAPYLRLWKESSLLHRILHNERFSNWKPQAARYVALRAIKAQGANQELPEPVLDLLESFLRRREPVVLLGEPGAGKTTALEALTYRLAKRALIYNRLIWLALLVVTAVLAFAAPLFTFIWLASLILWEPLVRRFTVPMFIEARSDYFGGGVNEWCERIFKERLGAKPLIGSRHRVALFIDGVNEVQASLIGRFVEGWRARLRDQRACRVIFTSRGGEESPAQRLSVEKVLSVCDLDDDGVREFLQVYGREKTADQRETYKVEQAKRDFDQLQKKNLLGEGSIGRNPYWLKMIVESGLYTLNRGALFRSFTEKLIRREIEEKPEDRKHKPDWKTVPFEVEIDALSALALAMHDKKQIGFTDETGWSAARAAIRESIGDLPYSADDVLGEAQASTLLRVQFKKRIEFVHQLVQEFFAAYALHPESKWQDALAHCEDVWWWQTLFNLGGLVGAKNSAESYIEFALKVLGDGSNEHRVFAGIGLLRSVENTPPEFSNAVIEAFAGLMEKNLILREGTTTLNLTEAQRRATEDLTRTLGEEAAEAFAMLLEHPTLAIQIIGILILSIVGNKRAAELIIMKFDDSLHKSVGINPLVRIGTPDVEPLSAALQDNEVDVCRSAMEALVRIGAPSVEPLIGALSKMYFGSSSDEDFEAGLEYALVKIGALSVGPLIAALRDEVSIRRRAAKVLGLIRDARATEPLIAALQDEDLLVRGYAAQALGQIGDARFSDELERTARTDKEDALRYLAREAAQVFAERLIREIKEITRD
jgi:HEAT repeat protein